MSILQPCSPITEFSIQPSLMTTLNLDGQCMFRISSIVANPLQIRIEISRTKDAAGNNAWADMPPVACSDPVVFILIHSMALHIKENKELLSEHAVSNVTKCSYIEALENELSSINTNTPTNHAPGTTNILAATTADKPKKKVVSSKKKKSK